jgi:NADH-quinone oxidoreductase subunit M
MFNFSIPAVFLSWLVFLPAVVALVIAFLPFRGETIKQISFAATAIVFVMSLCMILGWSDVEFQAGIAEMQNLFAYDWIPSFGIQYLMATDGISFPLIILTTFLTMLAMAASWPITKHEKAYCVLFLLLETGMIGVFAALDFFLFYVFWEVMLLPMYFLIGIWGGPRKEYAAIKFFLYTLFGSVLMLIAILMLYFNSDLRQLPADQLVATGVVSPQLDEQTRQARIQEILDATTKQHTFNILAMQYMGQHTNLFTAPQWWGHSLQWWAFILLFIGFAIKVPSVPLHTWLPDAHVEAPTPISMILAGILLKMGGYGIIRICYPICPQAGYDLAYVVCGIGVVSMVYGAFAAMAQTDFKRLVAYSSVSHMGYVVLGLGVWSAVAGTVPSTTPTTGRWA